MKYRIVKIINIIWKVITGIVTDIVPGCLAVKSQN